MSQKDMKPRKGRFAVAKAKATALPRNTTKCSGCGVLCAAGNSLRDHEMYCPAVADRHEMTPIRGIEFLKGDLRVYN